MSERVKSRSNQTGRKPSSDCVVHFTYASYYASPLVVYSKLGFLKCLFFQAQTVVQVG